MILEIEISDQAENANGQLDRLEKGILSLNQMPGRFREYYKSVKLSFSGGTFYG